MRRPALLLSLIGLIGLHCTPSAPAAPVPAVPKQNPTPVASASALEPKAKGPESCGPLDCLLFDTPQEAFSYVLRSQPAILGVGEFHAPRGYPGLESPVRRFTQQLLPMLSGKASDIILEAWVGTDKCHPAQQKVAREQKPVTEQQAENTQNEYVELGNQAQRLGIAPHALRPSCQDYERILAASPEDRILQMLKLTSQMHGYKAAAFYKENQSKAPDKMILTYGGAMHNDIYPDHSCGKDCAFGPSLRDLTGSHYVELDLVVPEYIHDSNVWTERVWYPHFDKTQAHPKVTLYQPKPGAFVLVFPSTPGWKPPQDSDSPSQ